MSCVPDCVNLLSLTFTVHKAPVVERGGRKRERRRGEKGRVKGRRKREREGEGEGREGKREREKHMKTFHWKKSLDT